MQLAPSSIALYPISTSIPTYTREKILGSKFNPSYFNIIYSFFFRLRSPGYALSLLAESSTGALHCAEAVSPPTGGVTPEDIALLASRALLSEIKGGGCVDTAHQVLVLLFMVLGSEDVGRCRMGAPSART